MPKVFFIFSLALSIISVSLAQDEPSVSGELSAQAVELKTCKGKVAIIFFDERTRDFPARVEIVDEGGQRLVFAVEEKIPAFAKNGSTIYLRKVVLDDTIVIEYFLTKKNRKIAKSIRVVE